MGERPRGNKKRQRAQHTKFTKTNKVLKVKELPKGGNKQ